MKDKKFNLENMREFEIFSSMKVPINNFIVLRLDGKGFSKFTDGLRLEKPFDSRFMDAMNKSIISVMKEFGVILGYTESDEITLLLPRDSDLFKRRVEKILSIIPSRLSVEFTRETSKLIPEFNFIESKLPTFDCRILPLPTIEDVKNCFLWRQNDGVRNALNGAVFWSKVKSGISRKDATNQMKNLGKSELNEVLFNDFGFNFNDMPDNQKRGTIFFLDKIKKKGFNPKLEVETSFFRMELVTTSIDFKNFSFEEYFRRLE